MQSSPFQDTIGVLFELSNRCPYSAQHPLCPLHLAGERTPKHLEGWIVRGALVELGQAGFSGRIAFHNYNEPTIDPRLFTFIALAKERCPQAHVFILTNGYMLDAVMMKELVEVGVDAITVSAYSDA